MARHPKEAAPVYDASKAASALAALKDRVDSIRPNQVEVARVDLARIAIMLLGVADRVASMRHRFDKLPKEEFDSSQLDVIEPLAWAFWHVDKQIETGPKPEGAKIPAALYAEAQEIEARMQNCCEYHLMDDPLCAPTLIALRPGTGYRDLAGDLAGYAEIYRTHHDVVSHDKKNYRPGDERRAVEIATTMLKLLGAEAAESPWTTTRDKLWTFGLPIYEDVAKTGRWLMRREPGGETAFPNIYFAGRPKGEGTKTTDTSADKPAVPNGQPETK